MSKLSVLFLTIKVANESRSYFDNIFNYFLSSLSTLLFTYFIFLDFSSQYGSDNSISYTAHNITGAISLFFL